MKLLGPAIDRPDDCEAVLRSLPGWFGIEASLRMYVADARRLPTFAYEHEGDGTVVAFLSLMQHIPQAWEVHCMAVHAEWRGQGLGSALLAAAERWIAGQGARYLQVKTVAATSDSAAYAQTRPFYLARGFVPLEVFPTLWDARNPALQLIKALEAA